MTSEVYISTRVVAAGPAANGKVRLTISLMPGKKNNGGVAVDVSCWPREIHDLLMGRKKGKGKDEKAHLSLIAKRIDLTPNARPKAPDEPLAGLAIPYNVPDADSAKVQELWVEMAEYALSGQDGFSSIQDFWTDLANIFSIDAAAGQSYVDVTAKVPCVLPTGRGDAAILHLLGKAERLASRVRNPNTEPVATWQPEAETKGVSVWAEQKDGTGKQINVGSDDKEEGKKLDEVLRAALSEEAGQIDNKAAGYFSNNTEYLNSLSKLLEETSPAPGGTPPANGGFPSYAASAARPTLVGYPIWKLFDSREEGRELRKAALDQAQTLHLAALLPDDKNGKPPPKGALSAKRASELEKDTTGTAPVGENTDYLARTLVAAVRSSPMLARLFRFVVDVEMDPAKFSLQWISPDTTDEDAYDFIFLGAGEVDASLPAAGAEAHDMVAASNLLYSIAKATRSPKGDLLTGFWPATREELDLRCLKKTMPDIRRTGAVSQVDGVVDLGQSTGSADSEDFNPRFDIISIDPTLAMEASVRNMRKTATAKESLQRLGLDESTLRAPFHNEPDPGVVSRGLAIVDRRRAEGVAKEILAAAHARKPDQKLRIIDADDLTVGYRVDVAVRTDGETETEWRSLMEREIDYRRRGQETGKVDDTRQWFQSLSLDRSVARKRGAELKYEADRRRDYDAGMMMPTARRRLRTVTDADPLRVTEMIHAEELIAAWEGDPLGLNCGSDKVLIRPGSDVAISRFFYLPNESDEDLHKAWPLRYGWAYRFGVRPVWLGGVSLSLEQAKRSYDSRIKGYQNLSLPGGKSGPVEVKAWRRFLRYESILAPVVLLPDAVANEKNHLGPQSGIRAILRTLASDQAGVKRFSGYLRDPINRETDSTWRVILPPQLSLDEAVRHGVFDRMDDIRDTAPGGLLEIDYDTPIHERAKGQVDSVRQSEKITPVRTKAFPAVARANPEGEEGSEAKPAYEDFFRLLPKPKTVAERGDAAHQYYVDPMADQLVVAIRPNTNRPGYDYFDGKPRFFDVGSKQDGGRVIPVALQIKRDPTSAIRERKPRQSAFWLGEKENRNIDGTTMDAGRGAGIPATVATLHLRAGESVDVDCWFVPSVAKLRAYFGWPETLAVQAIFEARAPKEDLLKYRASAIAKLREILQGQAAGTKLPKEIQAILDRYKNDKAWVGLGGMTADPAVVAIAAEILHQHMMMRPIPEIAAVQTIDVVHAVARPPLEPAFKAALTVLRSPSGDEERMAVLTMSKTAEWLKENSNRFGKNGDDGIVFAGKVLMDRDTCRQLEIRAHCVSPARTGFDDVRLGRTELQRLLGEWPRRVIPKGNGTLELTPSARHLFGFDVDVEGRVYLPKQSITLLRLDDLAERAEESDFTGLETIDLVETQIQTLERRRKKDGKDSSKATQSKAGAIRAAPLDGYSNRLARKITLVLRATSRFDPYFLCLAPTEKSPLPETRFPPDPDEFELITRASYDKAINELEVPPAGPTHQVQTLWIPSTIVPAKPQVHAVLPAYNISRPKKPTVTEDEGKLVNCWVFRRKPRLRIILDRPWYSSGEGERLGLVLWPPRLKEIASGNRGADQLKDGIVRRDVLHGDHEPSDLMLLSDFSDEDLGPGGKFTTRWGADPIRKNSDPIGPFLPLEVLLDLKDKPASGAQSGKGEAATKSNDEEHDSAEREIDKVLYVPRVTIPLKDLREIEDRAEDGPKAEKEIPETAYETLTAALLTYVPRFDVETEKWFVDVKLNPDRVVEPFIRLGLVRYQPEAAEELRVSAPVATWAQVLPTRIVEVFASTDSKRVVTIRVQISGPASGRSKSDAGTGEDLVYPRMRVSVVDRAEVAAGQWSETVAVARRPGTKEAMPAAMWAEGGTPAENSALLTPRPWIAGFTLPPVEDHAAERSLSVLVEEVEDFLSTANERVNPLEAANAGATKEGPEDQSQGRNGSSGSLALREVVGETIGEGHSRSGPRFLARIEIDVGLDQAPPSKEGGRMR